MKTFIGLLLLFCCVIVNAAPIAVCEWQPAADVYTGTAEDAVMTFTDIPIDIRKTLAARVKGNPLEYSDVVRIGRDSISGRNSYMPGLTNMHFGSKGRMCISVSRTKWTDSQTTGGLVYCEDDYCVIRPEVCNNWSMVRRIRPNPERSLGAPEPEPIEGIPPGGIIDTPNTAIRNPPVPALPVPSLPPLVFAPPLSPWIPAYLPPALFPCPSCCIPVVPAVPEPSTWAALALGLVVLRFTLRKK